ncbi:hypothetical protein LC653_32780 [Nostoc sp. CHAB 5784]|uniref:hypothetical protein n=1 Tax=Nostoc mirabile TaxID=2907820 RepID=UPI001E43BDE9|nr:hypothetical protein [Nostoc mirabile]MCC5668497.1 hypothetical protein [Nostoc mirabile CHAB5784]
MRFHGAIAIILSNRLQSIINQFDPSNLAQGQPLRDVLFMLGELHDSDIDWMVTCGITQKNPANTVLIHEGVPQFLNLRPESLPKLLDIYSSRSIDKK